jgi:hypothetical protein
LVFWLGGAGACEASGEVVFVLDDWSGAGMLWLLLEVEFMFTFDEALGAGAALGVEGVPGVMPCMVLVEVTDVGVASGMTTGGKVGLGLASVSELLRLQPTKAQVKLTEGRAIRNLFLVGFIDVFTLVRLDTAELIYFPTLSIVRGNGKLCYGVFTPSCPSNYSLMLERATDWKATTSKNIVTLRCLIRFIFGYFLGWERLGSSENLVPRTIELFHDLAQLANRQALLKIFNPMEGPVGEPDFAGKSPHRLVASFSAQVFR